jgi:hypothetical protein
MPGVLFIRGALGVDTAVRAGRGVTAGAVLSGSWFVEVGSAVVLGLAQAHAWSNTPISKSLRMFFLLNMECPFLLG